MPFRNSDRLWRQDVYVSQQPASSDIRAQVRTAVDPTGEQFALLDAVAHSPNPPGWLSALVSDLDAVWATLGKVNQEYRTHLADLEGALRLLVPRGWAVFNMESDAVRRAVALVSKGDGQQADELLADQWEKDTYRTKRVCSRVGSMGAAEPDYHAIFVRRAQLLRLVKDHHDQGRYDASVPLLHTHIEGITTDVASGRKFFSRARSAANMVDPTQLVSIESSLAALQALYTDGVHQTQVAGSLSRHGVAHGRELAYDTRVNSAKSWSVLDALVEWALPLARQEADRLRADRQAQVAGSVEVDEEQRRLDDREFTETKAMLRTLQTSAMGWWRQRGHFRDDLIGGVYSDEDFAKRGLPAQHDTQFRIRDGQEAWFWRRTISGWVLGIGLVAKDGNFLEWLYAAGDPPLDGPLREPDRWGPVYGTPPDWLR